MISEQARLLRGFAIDFLTSHDVAAVEWIMDPRYRLSIGGFLLDGRDESYLPATAAQLDQFAGLCVTVHDTIFGIDGVAMRFTEHGVSGREGTAAAWGGITLFRIANGRLAHGWAEEDYFARKRQLKSGECDAVLPPHAYPWDAPVMSPSAQVEAVVTSWASDPTFLAHPAVEQIASEGPRLDECFEPARTRISHLFTAGSRAALHLECEGHYSGGFADIDAKYVGAPAVLRIAAMVDVADGQIMRAQISADRLGLHRALLDCQGTRA